MTVTRDAGPDPVQEATSDSSLGRLAGYCYDRRRLVLVLWILAIIGITALAQVVGTHFQNNFSAGNTPSQQAANILTARFPSQVGRHRRRGLPHGGPDHQCGQPGRHRQGGGAASSRCPTSSA